MQVSTKIDFENLNNTRDLGGMPAEDGRRIVPGKLIRSGHLFFASEADADRLSALVGEVVDFRNERECAEKPDPELAFVTFHRIPIFGKTTAGVTREESVDWHSLEGLLGDADGARDYMCRTYGASWMAKWRGPGTAASWRYWRRRAKGCSCGIAPPARTGRASRR